MAESLVVNVAGTVLGKIASLLIQGATTVYNLRSNLREFHNTIDHVKAVILDSEEARLSRHQVCTLAQLKDVLSDAEDVLALFAYYEAMCTLHAARVGQVWSFLSISPHLVAYRLSLTRKVADIRKAFDEVASNITKFHLNMVPKNSTLSPDQRELTHSLVTSRVIIGRDRDRDTIVGYLMDSAATPEEISVSVVSIVGIGGMGKTALAKMVFNDHRVVDRFEKMIWVCLGDIPRHEFSVKRVMAKLVKSIAGKQIADDWEPEQLQRCLRDKLRDKRFLLVLDDVWVADGRDKWSELKKMLMCGVKFGSKVIVTTRDSEVAENMGSNLVHSLKGLTDDQCVSLFKEFAFSEGEVDPNLMKIGVSIVRKCKGVPLAIKTLGCLLSSKKNRNRGYWVFVRDNELWKLKQEKDGILPELKISYNQLPFALKQCFVYCVIFPKEYEFSNVELITHWSGYGLLESEDESEKDVGEQYIHELCARGFFQDFEENLGVSTFKMHDLFHDLALSFTQSTELRSIIGKDVYKRIRHVSFSYSRVEGLGGKEVPKLFLRNNSRASCIMPAIWSVSFCVIGEESDGIVQLLKTCISELEHLRIMDLRYVSTLKHLPRSIGDLKLLTYLSLVSCKSLKRLPDSICKLYNLQTLSLYGCESFEELPEKIGDLLNLTTLELTTKQARLSEGARNGIESLSSLQELTLDGCENLKHVFESRQSPLMTSLRALKISNCKSLTSLAPSVKNSSRELTALETLYICECPNVNLASIFNNEIRLVRLRWLVLGDLAQMKVLPEWIEDCATSLEFLGLECCKNLVELPSWLCNLISLHRLIICDCPKLWRMPGGLGALKDLEIAGCPELSQRCKREDWPKIEHIPKINLEGEYQ